MTFKEVLDQVVAVARRIVQALDTSMASLVGRFAGIKDDPRSGT